MKFCRPEHNILNRCHTIRFGTLEYYREMDPSFAIADSEEGRESMDIQSVSSENASPEVRKMFPVLERGGTHIEFSKMTTTGPNCWIWCCSLVPQGCSESDLMTKGKSIDSAYTSSFGITNRFRFAECLTEILANSLPVSSGLAKSLKDILGRFTVREMNQLRVRSCHNVVEYIEEKKQTIDRGQVSPYSNLPPFLRRIFTKPKTFARDKEYRFAFWLEHPLHGVLSVQKDPIDLPILPISEYQKLNNP